MLLALLILCTAAPAASYNYHTPNSRVLIPSSLVNLPHSPTQDRAPRGRHPFHFVLFSSSDGDESDPSPADPRLSEENEAALRASRKAAFEDKVEEMGATIERSSSASSPSREAYSYTVRDMTKAPSEPVATKNVKLPLLGSIEVDGSSLLVLPAAVIGVLGVLTSIYIGLTSTDSVERALEQLREVRSDPSTARLRSPALLNKHFQCFSLLARSLSQDEKAARSTKKVERKDCRGLCGSQEDDLSRKLEKVEGKTGAERALSIFF